MPRFISICLLLWAIPAHADLTIDLLPNFDDTIDTEFPAGDKPVGEPPEPPVWNTTPAPIFDEGVADTYSLLTDCSDPNGDALTFALNASSAALPTGVTLTGSDISHDGTTSAPGTTNGIIIDCSDPGSLTTASPAFPIVINATGDTVWTVMTPAYESVLEGWACYGCDWGTFFASSPTIEIRRVTNTNTSGAGSFQAAISETGCNASTWTIVVFETSGMVDYPTDTHELQSCENLYVAGGSAPSPGFYFRDVVIHIRDTDRQVWTHLGGFSGLATTQPTGKCYNVTHNSQPTTNIVLINVGCVFGVDGAMDIFDTTDQTSILQSMMLYAVGFRDGTNKFATLWGSPGGSSGHGLMARNIMMHANGRFPKANGIQESALANNVMYNPDNTYTDVAHGNGNGAGFDTNIIGNIYIKGPDTVSSTHPIWIHLVENGTRVFVSENREFGTDFDDTNQNNLINNDSVGDVTLVGARMENAWPDGFETTPIGSGTPGLLEAVNRTCAHAGPRPADTARPAHWDRACTELTNAIDGTGPVGGEILNMTQHPDGGPPAVTVVTCDLDIANDCGAGIPAIPGSPTVANMRTWLNDVYCARMPAGATGC